MNDSINNFYCKPLIGLSLKSLENIDYSWDFVFSNDKIVIVTESPWRFIVDGQIFVTSQDHGHQFGLPEPLDAIERVRSQTRNHSISAVSIHPATGDLTVSFGKDIYLQFLQMSCGYESWRLYVEGSEIICHGGGKVS